jgi:hypothetical protein
MHALKQRCFREFHGGIFVAADFTPRLRTRACAAKRGLEAELIQEFFTPVNRALACVSAHDVVHALVISDAALP